MGEIGFLLLRGRSQKSDATLSDTIIIDLGAGVCPSKADFIVSVCPTGAHGWRTKKPPDPVRSGGNTTRICLPGPATTPGGPPTRHWRVGHGQVAATKPRNPPTRIKLSADAGRLGVVVAATLALPARHARRVAAVARQARASVCPCPTRRERVGGPPGAIARAVNN